MKSNYLETLEKLQNVLTMFDMSFSVSNKVFRLALVAEILDTACLFEQLYNSWSEHLPFGEGPDADVDFAYWKELSSWGALLDSAKQNACIDDYPVDMGNGITSDVIPMNRRKNYLKSIGSIFRHSQFSGKEAASNFIKVINSDKTHMMAFGNMVFEALTPLLLILSEIETLLANPDKSLYADYFERQKSRFDEICEENKRCILGIVNENLSNRRKCNKLNALKDVLWKNLYESKFLDALKDGINTYDISDYHNDHPDIGKTDEEIRELLAFEELVNKNMAPDKEKTGQYIYRLRKDLSFEDISAFYAYLYAIPIIKCEIERLNREEALKNEVCDDGMPKDKGQGEASDSSCFKFPNELVKQKVAAVIKEFHHGKAVNLAVMEAALFDHNLLYKRDSHTAFIKTMIHWHIIKNMTDEEITKIANGMSQKMKKLPEGGYKGWKDRDNERALCMKIEKALGADFPYDATRSGES